MWLQELALDAVSCVTVDLGDGKREIDIKNYAKVEKIPGGTIEDCKVLKGEYLASVKQPRICQSAICDLWRSHQKQTPG